MRDQIRYVIEHCAWRCDMGRISRNDEISIKNL